MDRVKVKTYHEYMTTDENPEAAVARLKVNTPKKSNSLYESR
jgi:hypothetical protein